MSVEGLGGAGLTGVSMAPTNDKTDSVQSKIEAQIGKVSDLYNLISQIMRDIAELKGPGDAPTHPGEGASEEQLKKYQNDLKDYQSKVKAFESKLSALNSKLDSAQSKLARAENELRKLQSQDLPEAQRKDANELRQWTEDTRKAMDKQLEATASSTQEDKDYTVEQAEVKVEVKVVQLKRQVKESDGQVFEFNVSQLQVQRGDQAITSNALETTMNMPKPPASGII